MHHADQEAAWTADGFYDERNLVALCWPCHSRLHNYTNSVGDEAKRAGLRAEFASRRVLDLRDLEYGLDGRWWP